MPYIKQLLQIEENTLTSMMVLECLAREWAVPLNENVIQSICNRICFIHETTQYKILQPFHY